MLRIYIVLDLCDVDCFLPDDVDLVDLSCDILQWSITTAYDICCLLFKEIIRVGSVSCKLSSKFRAGPLTDCVLVIPPSYKRTPIECWKHLD